MNFDKMYLGFYDLCTTISATLSSVVEVVTNVASANYEIVSVVYHYATLFAASVFWLLEAVVYAVLDLLYHICDFTADLFGCLCTLCYLVWKVVLLLYKMVCLVLTGIETLAVCIWTGSCVTVTTFQKSAIDVIDTCGLTWNYVLELSQTFIDTVFGGFSVLGTLAVSIVKGIFSGLGYGFSSLLACSWKCGNKLCKVWENLTSKLVEMFTLSREVYLGMVLCCLLYVTISEMIRFFSTRGVSIWSLWHNLTRRQRPQYTQNMYGIDGDFESDLDEEDFESEGEGENDNASEGTITEDSDNDLSDDHDGESNESEEADDSEDSLNSQAFSSDDSDNEIEVQLPAPTERYNLRSRSSTPNWAQKQDMTSSDYENEIEREKDKRKCVVCQDLSKSVLILPCRHMCLCVDCADRIVRSRLLERRVCPLCRQRIQKVMNVYV